MYLKDGGLATIKSAKKRRKVAEIARGRRTTELPRGARVGVDPSAEGFVLISVDGTWLSVLALILQDFALEATYGVRDIVPPP